jgi:hypothetical protein
MSTRRLFLVFALLAAFQGQALAQGTLIDAAEPAVKAALLADGGQDARAALDTIAARGAIDRGLIERALAKRHFASYARDTLIALSQVDTVPGAKRTLERVVSANNEGGVVGAAFEIQAAALIGPSRVAAIGAVVDGNEVDLLLKDGTRVEVKFRPDNDPGLSAKMVRKATDQLRLRGGYGDPVLLITNLPLSANALATFRKEVGQAAGVMVLEKGALVEQLKPVARTNPQRLSRQAVGAARRGAKHTRVRIQRSARVVNRARRAR